MPKEIKVTCWGSIALSDKYKSYWEDVWLTWKGKPGRKKYYSILRLSSKTECESKLKIKLEYQKKYHYLDYINEIDVCEKILTSINNGQIYIDYMYSNIPNVHSPKEFIDRKEAEVMIGVVLKEIYDIKNIKCNWLKPSIIIIPT